MRSRIGMLAVVIGLVGCGTSEPGFQGAAAAGEAEHHHASGHAEGEGAPAEGHPAEGHPAEGQPAEGQPAEAPAGERAAGPQPTRVLEDGARLYGAELQGEREAIALAQIVASPAQFQGQIVRTSGTIERVCQRMGCWMELRAEDTPAVRVPMAGHAFFLPRDAAGREATIEGRVEVQELSADMREHLASEGAVATASSLSIDATSVVVR